MPRQVDHDQRRRQIIAALWSVTAKEGLGAVSFRKVATEADVSVRRIQYYFGDKAGLLRAALEQLGERVVARGISLVGQVDGEPTVQQVLANIFRAGLPLDDESRQLALLFFSFHVAAVTDPDLATVEAKAIKQWTVPFIATLIGQAQDQGGTHPGIDPDHEALLLMSAFDGLSLDLLAGNRTSEQVLAAVDYQLGRIFNGTPTTAVLPEQSTPPSVQGDQQ